MNHTRAKHYVSIAGIVVLGVGLVAYLLYNGEVNGSVVISFIAGIAGLGGYNLRQRQDTSS